MQKHHFRFLLSVLVLFVSFSLWIVPSAGAQGVTYSVSQEWVEIWINTDRSVDVQYNITFMYLTGEPQGISTVGMPKGGFQVEYVHDLSGSDLQFQDVSQGSFYGIDVYLSKPIILNYPYTFIVYAVVPGMLYADESNSGNVGLLFYPSTFPSAIGSIADLRVAMVLPQGVQSTEVKYSEGVQFDNVFLQGNNTVVYWERHYWSPSQTFMPGVSFPANYVSSGPSGPSSWVYLPVAVFVVLLAVLVIVVLVRFGKSMYQGPRISVEALGALRGLTAVEAGVVLEQKPVKVLTMILYGLLLKRVVAVTETAPLVKLMKLKGADAETPEPRQGRVAGESAVSGQSAASGVQLTGSHPPVRYYEREFLKAINSDGTLDEIGLARAYLAVDATVSEKLRGHSREDTVNYYKSIVDQAWAQVTQAGTPELKGDALDKNLEWLLEDEKFDDLLKTAFPPGTIITPMPGWWWYWGGPWSWSGRQGPPSVGPSASAQAKPLPVQDFANNIVRGLQATSNSLVKDVQEFTNRLIPLQTVHSERPVRGWSSCVCACHACACACACVSCACACAGGGGR
jgi:hypothetical protein